MSRVRPHDNSGNVSLFPFLAVLICTMGSLIVVLLVVTRLERNHAKERAATKAQTAAASGGKQDVAGEACRELAEVERYLAELNLVRNKAENQLQGDQLRLRQVEDHMRRLQDQLAALLLTAEELDAMSKEHYDDRDKAQHELERLRQLIAETRAAIDSLTKEAAGKRRSYAIVPYVGPNGTTRRPIFIECRDNQVILQPEGITLSEADFLPPFGPGNPLAATVRTAREYMIRQQAADQRGADSEPYALLVVRPSGIQLFHAVKKAMQSAEMEFGYQFVDGGWELKFPVADPQLANLEYRALEMARARQQVLAAAAPRVYGGWRTGADGGFGSEDFESNEVGDAGLGQQDGGFRGEQSDLDGDLVWQEESGPAGPLNIVAGAGSGGSETGQPGSGPPGQGTTSEPALQTGQANGGRHAPSQSTSGTTSDGNGSVDGNPSRATQAQANASDADGPIGGQGGRGQDGPTNGALAAGKLSGPPPTGGPGGPNASGNPVSTGVSPTGAAAGAVNSAATGTATSAVSQSEDASEADGQNPPGNVSCVAGGDPSSDAREPADKGPRTIAKSRGIDWSFRDQNPDAVPIRRTIQVVVRADRLAILPDAVQSTDSASGGKEIPLSSSTADSLEEFSNAIRTHVKSWGIAGKGLYWRPVLELNVGPDGQQRAMEFARLMKNSGLELRRAATAHRNSGGDTHATH